MNRSFRGPLSYLGVDAPTPPNFMRQKRDPTTKDSKNYNIGDIWFSYIEIKLFMLFDVNLGSANWVELYPGAIGAANQFPTDLGTAVAANNIVNVYGGTNINTSGAGNTLTINLDDSISLIGTLTIPSLSSGIGTVDNTGLIGSSKGSDGQVLIGSSTGDTVWSRFTSIDGSVVFTFGHNSIDMRAIGGAGGGGIKQFDSDLGSASPDAAGIIKIFGGTNVNTNAAVDTVYVNLDNNVTLSGTLTMSSFGSGVVTSNGTGVFSSKTGTDGQVLIGATGSDSAFSNITPGDASVTITNSANSISIKANCGAGGTVSGLTADDLNTATPVSNIINIAGGDNINTTAAGNTLTVNLDKSISQPATNASGTEGLYSLGGDDFMHSYGTNNTFLGKNSGNRTLTTASYNSGIGSLSLRSLTTGNDNTAVGSNSLTSLTTGDSNVGVGYNAAQALTTSSNNVAIGQDAMGNLTSGADNNVAIGYESLKSAGGSTASYNTILGYTSGKSLTGSYNTFIGTRVAENLVSGDNNSIIGYYSGSNYTGSESSNILINNYGTLGDSNKIRIGIQGTHDKCYIAGIYDSTVSERIVCVDSDGKLGTNVPTTDGALLIGSGTGASAWGNITSTGGTLDIQNSPGGINLEVLSAPGVAFLGTQAANVANVTGDGSIYVLGNSSALTEVFDTGGDYDPGGGSYAKFTAPADGVYFFDVTILLTNLSITGTYQTKVIIAPSVGDSAKLYNVMLNENQSTQSLHFSSILKLVATEYVVVSVMVDMVGSGKTIGVGATDTFFSGHKASGL